MERALLGKKYFLEGYNCSQSVVLAFEDILNIDKDTLLKLSSSFGGGIGRLRETCGAVSGIAIVLGILYGYSTPETGTIKARHYKRLQEVIKKFEEKNNSLSCRTLLNLDTFHSSFVPQERTEEFYTSRPCIGLIMDAIDLLDEYIKLEGDVYDEGRIVKEI